MKKILYTLLQCTWGIIQTLVGLFVCLVHISSPHYFYHGAIVTKTKGKTSVSLGLFVFTGTELPKDKRVEHRIPDEEMEKRLLVHEYGHTIQSIILGPLYLIIIGLPSMIWAKTTYFSKKDIRTPYSNFYTERWANHLGEKTTKEKSLEDAIISIY